MNFSTVFYSEILSAVERPSRYLGTELNSTHKNPTDVDLRVALVFPDLYDLGLGNLGILILYAILNDLPWCWCERAYAPAPDMEALLRSRDLPLFMNESKDSLADADLIGFTLQSELTYTNILNIIDLAGLPLRTEHRDDSHPLTFAGGPCVFNPEPLAPFMDFLVIGDGEDVVVEIAECMRQMKSAPRGAKLEAVAEIEGVYVPALYPFETLANGQVLPKEDAPKITKRIVRDLNTARFPTNYIVPYTQQVHDRVGLEVLRGCTQGCRFCQAGMTTRPVRERSIENVIELMDKTMAQTGYEELSLVSLSTCDFSRPRSLVQATAERARELNVAVSLPSLRLDSFSVDLADMVAGVRRSGLTFAPEAASPRLRAVINKWIPDEELLRMSYQAYARGWNHVKCYFMIGLPTERDDDIEAIVDLCRRTVMLGRTINPKARVHTGVSTFVPKPFTPFQWAEQIGIDETDRRQSILEKAFRNDSAVKFGRHTSASTFIEGLISRSDRRAADLIEAAWRNGARLETWDEHLNLGAWLTAIEQTGFNVDEAFRERDIHERLPWDHIDVMIPKQWFQEDWQRALELQHAQDCRHGKCHLCGVIYRERDLCKTMLKRQKDGRREEEAWQPSEKPAFAEPPSVQRLRFRIGRAGEACFLSNLELINAWIRALRRADAPLSYSQGFHAHPKITFSSAPPVGEESHGDYMDIVLRSEMEPQQFFSRLKSVLPEGFLVFDVTEVPLQSPSLMSLTNGFSYTLYAQAERAAVEERIDEVLGSDELSVERKKKTKRTKGRKSRGRPLVDVDIRPMIASLCLRESSESEVTIDVETVRASCKALRIRELIALLGLDPATTRVVKQATHLGEQPLDAVLPITLS